MEKASESRLCGSRGFQGRGRGIRIAGREEELVVQVVLVVTMTSSRWLQQDAEKEFFPFRERNMREEGPSPPPQTQNCVRASKSVLHGPVA